MKGLARQSRTKSDYLAQKAQRAPIVIFDPFGKLRIRLREKSFSDPSHSPRMTALACHFAFLAFLRRSSGQAWRENNPKPEPVRKCFVESQPKILQIERERIKNRLKYPQTRSSSPISQFIALFLHNFVRRIDYSVIDNGYNRPSDAYRQGHKGA